MTRQLVLAMFLCIAAVATGCTKCYIDPNPPEATYADLHRPSSPIPLVLTGDDQFNGGHFGSNTGALLKSARNVLQRTAVFSLVDAKSADAASAAHMHIVMNEVGSVTEALGKGAVSGATAGIAGQEMGETIEFRAWYQPPPGGSGTAHEKSYKQIVYTVTGTHVPPGVPGPAYGPFSIGDAVVERLILIFIRDLQVEGAL